MTKSSPKELEVEEKYMYDLFQLKTTLDACVQCLRDVVAQINTLTFCLSLKSLRAGTEEKTYRYVSIKEKLPDRITV